MSTTPSIFNEHQLSCTILGGDYSAEKPVLDVAVILLNSGNSHIRLQNLENLVACGFEKIISVENDSKNYSLEDFTQRFPQVKFIIPLEKATDGDLINAAITEIDSPYTLVLRDTLNITPQVLTTQLLQNLKSQNVFCVVPRLFSHDKTGVPVQFIPAVKKSVLKIESVVQVSDGIETLYPFNHLGFYNTQKFKELGGYDYSIKNSYWQNLDFAFRAWLWGEKIKVSTGFSLNYIEEIPLEDSTPDISQLRFFLKNMAPVYKTDRAEIPVSKFFAFKLRSSCGIFETVRQFNWARAWVRTYDRRFVMDAFKLISEWGKL